MVLRKRRFSTFSGSVDKLLNFSAVVNYFWRLVYKKRNGSDVSHFLFWRFQIWASPKFKLNRVKSNQKWRQIRPGLDRKFSNTVELETRPTEFHRVAKGLLLPKPSQQPWRTAWRAQSLSNTVERERRPTNCPPSTPKMTKMRTESRILRKFHTET